MKDTAGAGDWCTAGLILRLGDEPHRSLLAMASDDVSESLRYGQALAAWACRFEGPRAGMYQERPTAIERNVQQILNGSPPNSRPQKTPERAKETLRFLCLECVARSGGESKAAVGTDFQDTVPASAGWLAIGAGTSRKIS